MSSNDTDGKERDDWHDPIGGPWLHLSPPDWENNTMYQSYALAQSYLYNSQSSSFYRVLSWLVFLIVPTMAIISIVFSFLSENQGMMHEVWLEIFGASISFLLSFPVVIVNNIHGLFGSIILFIIGLILGFIAFATQGVIAHLFLEASASLITLIALEHAFKSFFLHLIKEAEDRKNRAEDAQDAFEDNSPPKVPHGL